MEPRSERRRRARLTGGYQPSAPRPIFGRRELIGAAILGGGLVAIAAALILLSGGGTEQATPGISASVSAAFSPASADELAIAALAQKSIEVLPRRQWPSLYDDFTPEFQQRCTREQFAQVGVQAEEEQGEALPLLGYRRLENVSIQETTATAVIVGEIRGQGEYSIQAAFQKVGGAWKIAPAPATAGCSAFNRI